MFLSTQRVTTNHQHNSQTDDINVFSIFLVFWITTINNNCTTWKPEKGENFLGNLQSKLRE